MEQKVDNENYTINALHSSDANQLNGFMMANSERLKRYLPKTLFANATVEDSREYIIIKNKEIVEQSNFTFALRKKENQKIEGLIILKKIDWNTKQGELAYCIGSESEGKGLTTYAVNEMKKFAFDQLQLKKLQIITHKTNLGSCKVAENNGFVWKKTLPNEFTPTNEAPLNMELYELTNER